MIREGQPRTVARALVRALREQAAHERAQRERRLFLARLQLEQIQALGQAFARGSSMFSGGFEAVEHTPADHADLFGLDEVGEPIDRRGSYAVDGSGIS